MSRIFLFLSLSVFVSATVAAASATPDPGEIFASRYQSYFDSLKLHYERPKGCLRDYSKDPYYNLPTCELAADLDGDGSSDYVALLEYIGGNMRSGDRYLDMIILFTSQTGEVDHRIYRNLGSVNEHGEVSRFLELQPKGEVELPAGSKVLENPAISLPAVDGKHNDNFWSFPTFYWKGDRFSAMNKAND